MMKGVQLGETHIPAKYKMLIGVAVAAALRSPHCSYFGTEAAKLRGATVDEIREAVLVSSLVNLGSTLLSGSQYDVERFKKEASEMLGNLRRREAEKVAV